MEIVIKSFNGIGDLLFVTPTLRVIKEAYPDARITVNTNHPRLLKNNPFVAQVGTKNEGVFLGYADPIHGKPPLTHHIWADWQIVCDAYNLHTERPALRPELYCLGVARTPKVKAGVGVQLLHKGHWHQKKVWPWFERFIKEVPFIDGEKVEAIPRCDSVESLVATIAGYKCVVCAEGGISHIAKAVGTPAVVIFGGFARPTWSGYRNQINLTFDQTVCSPCYSSAPCQNQVERFCMRQINPWDVERSVEAIFAGAMRFM